MAGWLAPVCRRDAATRLRRGGVSASAGDDARAPKRVVLVLSEPQDGYDARGRRPERPTDRHSARVRGTSSKAPNPNNINETRKETRNEVRMKSE